MEDAEIPEDFRELYEPDPAPPYPRGTDEQGLVSGDRIDVYLLPYRDRFATVLNGDSEGKRTTENHVLRFLRAEGYDPGFDGKKDFPGYVRDSMSFLSSGLSHTDREILGWTGEIAEDPESYYRELVELCERNTEKGL